MSVPVGRWSRGAILKAAPGVESATIQDTRNVQVKGLVASATALVALLVLV